jgi:Protein of unknown function (DUF2281)
MIAQPSDSIPTSASPTSASPTSVTLIEAIQAEIQALPPDRQQQVLDFVEFLAKKSQSQKLKKREEPEKNIWDRIDEAVENLPDEVWEGSPTDGSYQHDHYLYGTPKREL